MDISPQDDPPAIARSAKALRVWGPAPSMGCRGVWEEHAKRLAMATSPEQYVVDGKGRKTGVVLSLRHYRKLLEDLHDPAAVAEGRSEKPVALAEWRRRLQADGIL
jgi:hypothetical protein